MVVATMIDDVTETVTTGYRHCKAIDYRVVADGFDGSVEFSSELSCHDGVRFLSYPYSVI